MEFIRIILRIYIHHLTTAIRLLWLVFEIFLTTLVELIKFFLKIFYFLFLLVFWPFKAVFRRATPAAPTDDFSELKNQASQSSHPSLVQQQHDRFKREPRKSI